MIAVCFGVIEIVVAAADVEHAARARKRVLRHVGEEVAFAAQIGLFGRVVGDIAEILRAVVMADVVLMRRRAAEVGRLPIVAVLIPAPLDRFAAELADEGDVLLYVEEVESRIAILVGKPVDPAAHEGQRQRREGEIGGDVGWAPVLQLVGRGRLATRRRIVELRAPPRLGIIDQRRALSGRRARIGLAVDRAADRSGEAVIGRLG